MLGKHTNVVLQFSGGKDSLACLYLLRPYWGRLTVLWVNTGDAFPETIAQMDAVRALVPRFLEVRSAQPRQTAEHGYPSDVVSMWDTPLGRSCYPFRSHKMQTPFGCCGANLWEPMAEATRELGATLVIRGQRESEHVRAPIRSGEVHDGVEYLFPIEAWTERDVLNFLVAQGAALPANYAYFNSSLDCQHCTAYLFDNVGKLRYMREHHPALHAEVKTTLCKHSAAIRSELQHMHDALGVA